MQVPRSMYFDPRHSGYGVHITKSVAFFLFRDYVINKLVYLLIFSRNLQPWMTLVSDVIHGCV